MIASTLVFARTAHAQTPTADALPPPAVEAPEIPGMGYVPAGAFWMGRVRLWLIDEIGWQVRDRADDRPVHQVYLDAFYMDTHEVTNAAYAEFVQATGRAPLYQWEGPLPPAERVLLPVYNVSWHDAAAYCEWRGTRLPTEAEWEKAARGGLDRQDYPWGMQYQTRAPEAVELLAADTPEPPVPISHAWSNSATGPTAVGTFEPNGYGLYDMSGNVWEWTRDWYDLYAYSVSERRNPQGPADGRYKVIRGGGWSDDEIRLGTVYFRNFANPGERAPTVGFRCAMSADASPR